MPVEKEEGKDKKLFAMEAPYPQFLSTQTNSHTVATYQIVYFILNFYLGGGGEGVGKTLNILL